MPIETWLTFLLIFMIIGSLVALHLKDILSAIIAVGIVGLAVSLAFLFLQAPDLAIVQFLFEIVALVILVMAFRRADDHIDTPARLSPLLNGVTVAALAALFFLSIPVFRALPAFGDPLMHTGAAYLADGAADTGAANLVAAIILDYRAYDTLGEVTVLFAAVLGAVTILRMARRKEVHHG